MESAMLSILKDIREILINGSNNRWLKIGEVASYASISESTIRRAVKSGSLEASHTTGKLLFKLSNVENWLNR